MTEAAVAPLEHAQKLAADAGTPTFKIVISSGPEQS